MNSGKNEDSTVPKGWILCSSKSNPGRKYYFNRKTGKSSWTKPQDEDSSPDVPSKKRKCKEKEKVQFKSPEGDIKKSKKESPQKSLKRKSDGSSSHSTGIKKEDIPTSSKQTKKLKPNPVKKPEATIPKPSASQGKKMDTITRLIKKFPKPNLPKIKKNLASHRMSCLRANLSNESIEENTSSLQSPNTSQPTHNETKPKAELRSPSLNESKASTQSPNNEQPATSTSSQFFAANKIISSMKSQLQEEYTNKQKPKDSFADIEQGICNQVTEYPYMKHPATPPQFSEASKLMSAIKSKLSCKSSKEVPVQFSSAKERLETLRRSLSNEAMDTTVERCENPLQQSSSRMEVDYQETKQNVPVSVPSSIKDNVSTSKDNIVLVVDTNIFIQELDFIKNVMNSHIKGFPSPPTLLVPWRVINELDKLKDSNNGNAAICKRARPAMNYLYKYLPENDRIKVQPLRDANSHIYPCESPDDEILNCCLQQAERGKSVILLSNDKNLCTKAVCNGVSTRALRELELQPTPQPRAAPDHARRVQSTIYTLLSNILENEMRVKFTSMWERVVCIPPPWSLADVLQCLLKHWMAVFSEVFPRIEHLFVELRDAHRAIEKKASKNITQYDLSNFKELCLDVAKHCLIIPEYMELAKTTVARLTTDSGDDADDNDNVVIEAFEGVWTVLSSYCAKLCSGLGVPHSVEDKLPSADPLAVLVDKLPVFMTHVTSLTLAIRGVLTEESSQSEESVSRLESSLRDSLTAIGVTTEPLTRDSLRVFAARCRIMLQEAHSKFSQLVDLLQVCKNNVELNS